MGYSCCSVVFQEKFVNHRFDQTNLKIRFFFFLSVRCNTYISSYGWLAVTEKRSEAFNNEKCKKKILKYLKILLKHAFVEVINIKTNKVLKRKQPFHNLLHYGTNNVFSNFNPFNFLKDYYYYFEIHYFLKIIQILKMIWKKWST